MKTKSKIRHCNSVFMYDTTIFLQNDRLER